MYSLCGIQILSEREIILVFFNLILGHRQAGILGENMLGEYVRGISYTQVGRRQVLSLLHHNLAIFARSILGTQRKQTAEQQKKIVHTGKTILNDRTMYLNLVAKLYFGNIFWLADDLRLKFGTGVTDWLMLYGVLLLCAGNDNIHLLTSDKRQRLRVDLADFDGSTAYAEYDNFTVGSASDKYKLVSLGTYTGTAGKWWNCFIVVYYIVQCTLWAIKTRHFYFFDNSDTYWPIFEILSPLQSPENFIKAI